MPGGRSLLLLLLLWLGLWTGAAAASFWVHQDQGEEKEQSWAAWAQAALRPPGRLFQGKAGTAEQLILQNGCLNCHTLNGAGADVGPVLNGLRHRKSREEIRTWLAAPWQIKPGTSMPDFGFTEVELRVLADYLLRQ